MEAIPAVDLINYNFYYVSGEKLSKNFPNLLQQLLRFF